MHKRILVAEDNNTIRGIAESVLRQNGYDVISVPTGAAVNEVLEFSLPDLILVSVDLTDSNNNLIYEKLQDNPRTSSVPMLVLADAGAKDIPLPVEAVISKPFDPGDLIQRVTVFSGRVDEKTASDKANPLTEGSLDDDFLDEALGLDQIDVTDSEDMDKTIHQRKPKASGGGERTIGMGHFEENDSGGLDSTRIESLVIKEDSSEIHHVPPTPPELEPDITASGKLDIMSDQYGLADPDAFALDDEDQEHDYEWFINSMREDSESDESDSGTPAATANPPAQHTPDASELEFTDKASIIDPVTPGPKTKKSKHGGVDKFIDEFKREVKRIRSEDPDGAAIDEKAVTSASMTKSGEQGGAWEDTVEKLDPDDVKVFTRDLISQVAQKVAEKLVAQIDSERLIQMIKNEIIAHLRQDPKK